MKKKLSLKQYCLFTLFFSVVLILINGCSLKIATDASHISSKPSEPKKINRIFWGIVNKKVPVIDSFYPENGIQKVTFSTTKSEKLVTALTLGIYCPVNYTYVLALRPNAFGNHIVNKYKSDYRPIYDTNPRGFHDTKIFINNFTHDSTLHKPLFVNRLFWGLLYCHKRNWVIPNSSDNGGLQCIDIHSNIWESIVTLLSIGIYCPLTCKYKFAYLGNEY